MPLEPARTIAELEELRELTGDAEGAQRVAWTDTWERARSWLRAGLAETGAREEIDAAGNQWFTLDGSGERSLLIGGHLDSVPNGGWLDGCLNVLAGAEVFRRIAGEAGRVAPVRLVNWADEEGARFGRSLFGSSAACGSMRDQAELAKLSDRDGVGLPDALAEHGVDLRRAHEARSQLDGAGAYLELHIEQGPVLESLGLPLGVVLGTFGVERSRLSWRGQAAPCGLDADGASPRRARGSRKAGASSSARIAAEVGGGAVCTLRGRQSVKLLGIVDTRSSKPAVQLLDQRHLRRRLHARTTAGAREGGSLRPLRRGGEPRARLGSHLEDRADPLRRDADRASPRSRCAGALRRAAYKLSPPGPLHDAAEVARAGIPTVMLFVQSLRGLSHTPLEDTAVEHLDLVGGGTSDHGSPRRRSAGTSPPA